jgi:hypothetical protein
MAGGHFLSALPVGAAPAGIDLTPDGDTLVVAVPSQNRLLLFALPGGGTPAQIDLPAGGVLPQRPDNVRVLRNRRAFVTMTFSGSGFGGRVLEVNLDTRAITPRMDTGVNGQVTERTPLARSADGEWLLLLVDDNCCPEWTQTYSATINVFPPYVPTISYYAPAIGTDSTGARFLIGNRRYTSGLVLVDSLPVTDLGAAALSMSGSIGWFRIAGGIQARSFGGGAPLYSVQLSDPVRRMQTSPAGDRLAVLTSRELVLVVIR